MERLLEESTPLERYVQYRFKVMADKVHQERELISKLLSRNRRRRKSFSSFDEPEGMQLRRSRRNSENAYEDDEDYYYSMERSPREYEDEKDEGFWLEEGARDQEEIRRPSKSTFRRNDKRKVARTGSSLPRFHYNWTDQLSSDNGPRDSGTVSDTSTPQETHEAEKAEPSVKPRPRYLTDTASSRIRHMATDKEIRDRSNRDIPAHDEPFAVPLHLAARLGISF